jgi:histidinol-phosphate aminotransferase
MNPCDLAPAHVRAIAPYQPGKPIAELARELGMPESDIVKLASNENPLGPSPRALEAAQASLQDMAIYPDGAGFALKA